MLPRVRAFALPLALLLAATACSATDASVSTGAQAPTDAPAGSVTTTARVPRPKVYDNTDAAAACALLTRDEIAAAFGAEVGEPVAVDPFCQWPVGTDAWISLEIRRAIPASTFRKQWGAAAIVDAPIGIGGYFANNKALVFGHGDDTYILGYQRSGTWDDKARPQQLAVARAAIARLEDPSSRLTIAAPGEPTPVDLRRAVSASNPLHVWVGGDSLAGGPSWAIGTELEADGPVRTSREFHVGTGLTRPDFLNWHHHLAAEVDALQPEVLILMVGGNDAQNFVIDGKVVTPDDPAWIDAYRERVQQVLEVAATDGRAVIWVGLPPMREAAMSKHMARINQILAAEVPEHDGASFFDIWAMFSASGRPGVYADTVPDEEGAPLQVRLDGIHLNTDGSLLLARALVPRVRELVPNLPSAP